MELDNMDNAIEMNIIAKMAEMPANFFVSGDIPSLYMHQERTVIDALSRWPVRVMFSDEVGLGKTFEAAATLAFLIKYADIKRVVILTPKSVLNQWQEELYKHFEIDAWLYDSGDKAYRSMRQGVIPMNGRNPLGIRSPDIILMSAQYARGTKGNASVFLKKDTILPELLIVDEAHAARVTSDISGKRKKTQLYKMLEEVSKKIPHLILATATPMQKEAFEYHAMLKLLGLPKLWEKEDNYNLSLSVIGSDSKLSLSDTSIAGNLLYTTLKKMNPDTSTLSSEEQELVSFFKNEYKSVDSLERAEYILKRWDCFKSVFIKFHPARLLTVRNTRKSLTAVGYKFPKRNLEQVNLYNSDEIEKFYSRVNYYLHTKCFLMEIALNPNRIIPLGFIKISYQQRVASSLYSCKKSLERRLHKAEGLLAEINATGKIPTGRVDISSFEDDDWDLFDEDCYDSHLNDEKNVKNVIRAINLEKSDLLSLVKEADYLLDMVGDRKVIESINLVLRCVSENDAVLLFSRYTDTIDALLQEFNSRDVDYPYAVYTGSRAVIVKGDKTKETSKDEIKRELFAGNIQLVFCSDAASEGLNLQAARVLINVDVPWTPARLEQRIGRIARLGQKADQVDVYNVWYPHSVEAKMYTRIQQRLKTANLAVGDFPEVIAKEIRMSLLHDDEPVDSGLNQLKQIRNSYQTKALETLWTNTKEKITISECIRNDLIRLCKKQFDWVDTNVEGMIQVKLPDNTSVDLTAECGEKESINLKSLPFKYADVYMYNVKYVNDSSQNVLYIADLDGNPIKFEKILDISMNNRCIEKKDLQVGWPITLLNPNNLNLEYAVDHEVKRPLKYWKENN